MALSDADKFQGARKWIQKFFVEPNATATMNLNDIKAAVDAADAWVEANAASYNAALPQPFKGTATLEQKVAVLVFVAAKRAGLEL